MSTFYRVESNINGVGPYSGTGPEGYVSIFNLFGCNIHQDSARHPVPQEEGLDFHEGRSLCGFNSLEQLDEWFNNEVLTTLLHHSYNVVTYKVPPECLQVAKHQVLIDANKLDSSTREIYL